MRKNCEKDVGLAVSGEVDAQSSSSSLLSSGAARFATLVKCFASEKPLILFSGDAFNPSPLSTITQGLHMSPILNALDTSVAIMGNHDLDFGLDNYLELTKRTRFPWILSNVYNRTTGHPYAASPQTHVIESNGVKIGFLGLVEPDWIATLPFIDPSTIEYRDMFEAGSRLANDLRSRGCQYIIALTHNRLPSDELLAEKCPEINLICGGHDYDYVVKQHGPHGTWLVKSGVNFQSLTELRIYVPDVCEIDGGGGAADFITVRATRHDTPPSLTEDPIIKDLVAKLRAEAESLLNLEIGFVPVELDARFATLRTRESNVGNFVADCLRNALHGDACLINAGLIRSDRLLPHGIFTLSDLVDLLPAATPAVILEVPGSLIPAILENAVSMFPVLDGRFAQVSGIRFSFDSSAPSGSRLVSSSIRVANAPLDYSRRYRFVTTAYLASGKEGYNDFTDPSVKVLVDEENGICAPTALRNLFTAAAAKKDNHAAAAAQMLSPIVDERILSLRGVPLVTHHDIAAIDIQRIARARQARGAVIARRKSTSPNPVTPVATHCLPHPQINGSGGVGVGGGGGVEGGEGGGGGWVGALVAIGEGSVEEGNEDEDEDEDEEGEAQEGHSRNPHALELSLASQFISDPIEDVAVAVAGAGAVAPDIQPTKVNPRVSAALPKNRRGSMAPSVSPIIAAEVVSTKNRRASMSPSVSPMIAAEVVSTTPSKLASGGCCG